MQDRDTPPAAEGETGGGADAVRQITAVVVVRVGRDAIARIMAASIPLPWTTAIARTRAPTTDTSPVADCGRVLRLPTIRLTLSRCRCARTQTRAFLPSSMTCFSWRKFRRGAQDEREGRVRQDRQGLARAHEAEWR